MMQCEWMKVVGIGVDEPQVEFKPARTEEELRADPLALQIIAAEMVNAYSYKLPAGVSEDAKERAKDKDYIGTFYQADLIELIADRGADNPDLAQNMLSYFRSVQPKDSTLAVCARSGIERIREFNRGSVGQPSNDMQMQMVAQQPKNVEQAGDNVFPSQQPG